MTVSDLDIIRSANLHLDQHGDEAVAKAREMVRTMKRRGDHDGADTWLRIIVAIETMQRSVWSGVVMARWVVPHSVNRPFGSVQAVTTPW